MLWLPKNGYQEAYNKLWYNAGRVLCSYGLLGLCPEHYEQHKPPRYIYSLMAPLWEHCAQNLVYIKLYLVYLLLLLFFCDLPTIIFPLYRYLNITVRYLYRVTL